MEGKGDFIMSNQYKIETFPDGMDDEDCEIPSWVVGAVDAILLELVDFPKGVETTANRLIQPYLHYIDANGVYRERPYDLFTDERDVVDMLRQKAGDYGLYLDSSAYDNMTIGTPGNIPFQVRRVEKGSAGPKTIFKFSLGGMRSGWCSITIDEHVDEYLCTSNNKELLINETIETVTRDQISHLKATIKKAGVRGWEPDYTDSSVLDGENWSIMVNDAAGVFESMGSNMYPKGFDTLLEGLHELFGFEARPPEGGYESHFD